MSRNASLTGLRSILPAAEARPLREPKRVVAHRKGPGRANGLDGWKSYASACCSLKSVKFNPHYRSARQNAGGSKPPVISSRHRAVCNHNEVDGNCGLQVGYRSSAHLAELDKVDPGAHGSAGPGVLS